MKPEQFTCEHCNGTFDKGPEEEALAEADAMPRCGDSPEYHLKRAHVLAMLAVAASNTEP